MWGRGKAITYRPPSDYRYLGSGRPQRMTNAHFATVALENISLMLPPATDRNADPQHPVMNRNTRKTATVHVASTKYPPSR